MKRKMFYVLLLTGLFTIHARGQYLAVSGTDIVDSMGTPVLLKGMGLGGWLVPEGYQLHIPGFGSPSDIETKIENLIGEEEAALFWQRYRDAYVAEEDIKAIADWGFNSIRLPFHYRLLSPADQPDVFLEEGFAVIDRLLSWCETYGLYLILDLHCAPGGQNKDNISDSDGIEARLWTDVRNKERTVALWRKIAERYSTEPWIGGYDLINEPVLPAGMPAFYLRQLYIDIAEAIRTVDPNHIIFIEGNWYATDFTSLLPPFDSKLVYSFHKYWNPNTQTSIQSYLNLRQASGVPFWMGESGENSNTWYSDCVELLEQHEIGWCWWTHKKVGTLTSPLSAEIPASYQQIIDYWRGEGPEPTRETALEGFNDLVESLKLENCLERRGVLEALLNRSFRSVSAPYTVHIIPGLIPAEDYDTGIHGIAYADNDFQNVTGPGSGSAWNRGWAYRNDGVDVERSRDAGGTGWNVGWTEDGEWLNYTVEVAAASEYAVHIRTAAESNAGMCRLLLDGEAVTGNVPIAASGGYSDWITQQLGTAVMESGTHLLTLQVIKGGFNVEYLRFTDLHSSGKKQPFISINETVSLGRPYPNPFRKEVNFKVIIREPAAYTLKIYSLGGTLVRDLSSAGSAEAGITVLQWDGTDIHNRPVASGVYVYRFSAGGAAGSDSIVLVR